jgi:uncharacterized protein
VRSDKTNHKSYLVWLTSVRSLVISRWLLVKGPLVPLIIAIIFSACSMLSPRPDRTRFILLTPVTPGPSNGAVAAATPNQSSLAIGLGPVQFPEYLNRMELVTRTAPNAFELSDNDRWAEPLADNFRHVLASDLGTLLKTGNIVLYPWYAGTRLNYIVHIQVDRFDASTNDTAVLVARWDLRTPKNDEILVSREARVNHALKSLAGDEVAAGLSADLDEFAEQIASLITQIQQQHVARDAG